MKDYEEIKLQIEKDKALSLIIIGILFIVMGIIYLVMFIKMAQIWY